MGLILQEVMQIFQAITDKGFTIFDFSIVIFVIVLGFLVFFYINDYKEDQFNAILNDLIITENAISKHNDNGIGFAELDLLGTKTTFSNTIENPKYIEPIKKIEIYNKNDLIFKGANANCEKQIKISRVIIYEDEIRKAVFTFCN